MTNFVFKNKSDGDTVYVDSKSGTYEFSNHAEVDYIIDREDKDVAITINDYFFDNEALGQLIEFLTALRKEIA